MYDLDTPAPSRAERRRKPVKAGAPDNGRSNHSDAAPGSPTLRAERRKLKVARRAARHANGSGARRTGERRARRAAR